MARAGIGSGLVFSIHNEITSRNKITFQVAAQNLINAGKNLC